MLEFWSPLTLIFASGVVAFAAFVQASTGFGFAMAAGPLLGLIDPALIPGAALFLAVFSQFTLAAGLRRSIDMKALRLLLTGRIVGTLIAAPLVAILPVREMAIVFASAVLAAVGASVSGWRMKVNARAILITATVSGVMGTLAAIGAPPLALLFQHHESEYFRAQLNAILFLGALVSLVALAAVGAFGVNDAIRSVLLLPGVAVGIIAARPMAKFIDQRRLRIAVLAIASISAVVLLWRSLAALGEVAKMLTEMSTFV